MRIPAIDAALLANLPTAVGVPARVVGGNLAALPLGSLLQATVTSATPQNAVLNVNGQALTVRTPPGTQLASGALLIIRVPGGAATASNPTLEVLGAALPPAPQADGRSAPPPAAQQAAAQQAAPPGPQPAQVGRRATAAAGTAAAAPRTAPAGQTINPNGSQPRLAVVDVLAQLAGGRVQVSIDGALEPEPVTAGEPLTAGGRYVLEVTPTPAGLVLKPPPENAELPTQIATAVLRTPAPDLGAVLGPLQAELSALANPQPGATPASVPPAVRAAATVVSATLRTFVPSEARPPNAAELQNLVENGGRHFEAKLARLLASADGPATTTSPAPAATPIRTAVTPAPTAATPTPATPPTTPAANQAAPTPPTATVATTATATAATPTPANPPVATPAEIETVLSQLAANTADVSHPAGKPAPTEPRADTPARPPAPAQPTADKPAPDKPVANQPASDKPAADPSAAERPTAGKAAAAADQPPAQTAREIGPDLKGDLLRLLQAVKDIGGAVPAPAAAASALHGIESQQAAQSLAQANGTPYFLQIPFPDGGQWRTLHLALEPQNRPDDPNSDQPGRFRVFMHVPLTDLGQTWIDAGLSGDRFRATIYLDRPAVRDRVRAALGELRTELQTDGFSEVLLDVRAASDLPAGKRRETNEMTAGRPATVSVLDVRA
jgi:hypothetical protein